MFGASGGQEPGAPVPPQTGAREVMSHAALSPHSSVATVSDHLG